MSNPLPDFELIDTDSPWRHWEMERLDSRDLPPRRETSQTIQSTTEKRSQNPPTEASGPETAAPAESAMPVEDEAARIARERLEAKAEGYKEGFKKAQKDGYQAGLAEGRRKSEAEFDLKLRESLAPLATIAGEFSNAINGMSEDLSNQLVELALGIGNAMALDAIEENGQIINEAVQLILDSEIISASRPQLFLNPTDMELVDSVHGADLRSQGWRLRSDDKIARGGCRVKSEHTEIDASLETRWRAISDRVRQRQSQSEEDTGGGNP